MTRRSLLAALPWSAVVYAASPEHWPQFRGPGSRGVSGDDPRLPDRWSATENIAWKTPVPGFGWASPIVWGDRVFLTTAVSEGPVEEIKKGLYFGGNRPEPPPETHRWLAYGVDFTTGKVAWETELHRGAPEMPRHLKNSFASETPVTDGEFVYCHFGHLGTYCLDWNGKLAWSKTWPRYAMRHGWGTASSPVLHQGRLYIVNDNEQDSFLVSLDKRTGREIWRVERDEGSNWATPYIWENGGRTEIVTCGTKKVRSYDLDGKLLWEFGGMSSIVIPTPFAAHGLLYIASGYVGDQTRPVFAVRPGASGDISLKPGEANNESIAWSLPQAGPYNPSPLVYGDDYYTLFDRGFLTCHDARTGDEIYGKQRLDREARAFTASPWAYNGKIFCLSEEGETYVVAAGPEYLLLHKNPLGEFCMSTPAIAQGSLILRSEKNLYRIGGR